MAQAKSGVLSAAKRAICASTMDLAGYVRRTGLFIGPTIYFKLSERAWIAAAFSAQVAGQATAVAGSLDLVNFERRQARLQFGVSS
jgi:hypothetical protein